jgi:hypothetical protein
MAGNGDSWAPPSARPLKEEDWTPKSARRLDAPVFTGKEERAAEEKKLVESLGIDSTIPGVHPITNALAKLGLGYGHGAYNTHLNISDLMGHIPGNAGARVDPEWWRQQEELYGRTLGPDIAAGVGDLTGQTAMLAPVGGGAGAVTRAALPQALAAVAPLLTLGAEGAAQGTIAAGPENRAQGALTGLKFGLGTGAAGQVLGKFAQLADLKQEAILAEQVAKARAAQETAERQAAGELGSATQKGSRLEEQFARYVDDPNIPAELRAAIAKWKASPRSQELLSDVLTNQLEQAPSVSGTIAGKQTALSALQSGADDAIRAAALQAVSRGAALEQVQARAIRYGLPALAGYLGHHFLGPMGGAMGLAGGAVLRPMMHSFKHLAKNPAFQTALLRGGESLAGGLSGLAETAALSEGGLIPFTLSESRGMPAPLFATDTDNSPKTLAQLVFGRPQAEAY